MAQSDAADADHPPRRPRLPDAALAPLAGGPAVVLRAPRRGTVLVLLDRDASEEDAAYLRQLAAAEPGLRDWDGRVLVVAGGLAAEGDVPPALAAVGLPFPVLGDPGRTVARAAEVAAPALVIADQWGEVYLAREVRAGAPWLPPAEVEQWLRFLAIRCGG